MSAKTRIQKAERTCEARQQPGEREPVYLCWPCTDGTARYTCDGEDVTRDEWEAVGGRHIQLHWRDGEAA